MDNWRNVATDPPVEAGEWKVVLFCLPDTFAPVVGVADRTHGDKIIWSHWDPAKGEWEEWFSSQGTPTLWQPCPMPPTTKRAN